MLTSSVTSGLASKLATLALNLREPEREALDKLVFMGLTGLDQMALVPPFAILDKVEIAH